MALGGGPAATTLEVAIYQALRFDFDLDRAVALALLQVLFCASMALFARRLVVALPAAGGQGRSIERDDRDRLSARLGDGVCILLACLILLLPLAAVLVDGLTGPVVAAVSDPALGPALLRSLGIGLAAGLLATALALGLGQLMRGLRRTPGLAWAAGGGRARRHGDGRHFAAGAGNRFLPAAARGNRNRARVARCDRHHQWAHGAALCPAHPCAGGLGRRRPA